MEGDRMVPELLILLCIFLTDCVFFVKLSEHEYLKTIQDIVITITIQREFDSKTILVNTVYALNVGHET